MLVFLLPILIPILIPIPITVIVIVVAVLLAIPIAIVVAVVAASRECIGRPLVRDTRQRGGSDGDRDNETSYDERLQPAHTLPSFFSGRTSAGP